MGLDPPKLRILDDAPALARAAAAHVAAAARAAIEAGDRFAVALAGGSTPRATYRELAAPPHRNSVLWTRTVAFVGDERSVGPDHADSNYKMIHQELLSRVDIQPARVCRFESELPDERAVVEGYERSMRDLLGCSARDIPRLDLVLLGLGSDGHTAGLFPGSAALDERTRLATSAWVERLGAARYSLTLPVINRAAQVVFLVAGPDKAQILRTILQQQPGPDPLPAQRVRPEDGSLLWLVDRAAAARLDPHLEVAP